MLKNSSGGGSLTGPSILSWIMPPGVPPWSQGEDQRRVLPTSGRDRRRATASRSLFSIRKPSLKGNCFTRAPTLVSIRSYLAWRKEVPISSPLELSMWKKGNTQLQLPLAFSYLMGKIIWKAPGKVKSQGHRLRSNHRTVDTSPSPTFPFHCINRAPVSKWDFNGKNFKSQILMKKSQGNPKESREHKINWKKDTPEENKGPRKKW